MTKKSFWKLLHNIMFQKQKIAVKFLQRSARFKFRGTLPTIASLLVPVITLEAVNFRDKLNRRGKVEDLIAQADNLYEETQYDELFSLLSSQCDSNEPEILWRLARSMYEKARNIIDRKEKLEILEKALNCAEKALSIDEMCWAAHKWKAILLDSVSQYKGRKARILSSFQFQKHMERAIELNPKDSTSYYALGEWYFTFADLTWAEKKMAAAFFATLPTATYEEAFKFFMKAEEITPMFYSMNLLMLGKCCLRMNDKERAIEFFKKARDYPIKTPDDQQAHSEAEKLLQGLG